MNVVILVPRRDDNGYRDMLWAWTRRQWEADHPGWPIIEGYHTDGLFNRSKAVNLAARMAGDWDVAVIIDADVTIDGERVREAVDLADLTKMMVLPHSTRYNLSRKASEAVRRGALALSDDPKFTQRHAHRTYNEANGHPSVSSVVVVSRRQWDDVGGFDEEFRGWGYEDTAFHAACQTFGGVTRLDGGVFHFWHPVAREARDRATEGLNADRGYAYRSASGDAAAIRRLQNGGRPVLNPPTGRIPRILHRVVPEAPNSVADGWWARFEELHPDWELRTHRDPLQADQWPLTREHWDKCANGAQFADLIRLEALITWGGVYVDQDVEPLRPLDPLTYVPAFAAWEDANSVPNAVMGAVPDHPAMVACLELMISRLPGDTWQTGPGVMTAVLPGRADVLLLPPGSLYPYHYRELHREHEDFAKTQPWAFVVHHWWGSWLEEERRRVPA